MLDAFICGGDVQMPCASDRGMAGVYSGAPEPPVDLGASRPAPSAPLAACGGLPATRGVVALTEADLPFSSSQWA